MRSTAFLSFILCLAGLAQAQQSREQSISGVVMDEKKGMVAGATVTGRAGGKTQTAVTDQRGRFEMELPAGDAMMEVAGPYLVPAALMVSARDRSNVRIQVRYVIATVNRSVVVTATSLEPGIDRRNDAIYKNTLFSRDDQLLDTLASGINAGQHEGGGKSIEVRRFGYNLDHGGVNGGLKVLLDDVQQNQSTQGHGQGYLGALKSLSPELVKDVDILNGPFSAEYGDFSGLGVVHIHLVERLPNRLIARFQGGSFGALRTFIGWSPRAENVDSFLSYEGSKTDGPFLNPLRYRRDNLTGNYTFHFDDHQALGFKMNLGRNTFDSSGQIPLDQVAAGTLDRFGFIDPFNGGKVYSGTLASYFQKEWASGDTIKIDGFVGRSLFDLWSDFTFFLNDPVNGDQIQQHDSRLQEGLNAQWRHPWRLRGNIALLTIGSNFHDNQINVGLLRTRDRVPFDVTSFSNAHVTNGAIYFQQGIDMAGQRLHADFGLRYDYFRFDVKDRVGALGEKIEGAGELQPKVNLAFRPSLRTPITLYASYGRGISSQDARGVVQYPSGPKISTTDFYQIGTSHKVRRVSLSTDWFLIDRSNEQVYIADDGSIEFAGRSRSYGFEAKASVEITSRLTFNAGLTQVSNAFYRQTLPREYVTNAPHTVGNAGLTLAGWRGFYSSLRYRHISGYRLDGLDDAIHASGLDVVDLSVTKAVHRGIELNLAVDNLNNKRYYETQNYLESRIAPTAPIVSRIHGTPGYPIGITAGITFRIE
ncbi:MAG TPA: TonB-dependent receptor [Terriglobales bacterium]|nr:TonB-dependent receptor [Terriglobales bacterium]